MSLVKDVLDINKIESGSYIIDSKEFDLKEEVRKITLSNKPLFEEKGLYLTLDQSHLQNCKVYSDPGKIAQVLGNLIRNAFKFTKKGGIKITTYGVCVGQNLKVKIEISDTGIGIAKEHQKQIFDRFTQIDNGFSREYDGSGLGLSISKKIMEMLNGNISLESELGKGSTFTIEFLLPIVEIETPEEKSFPEDVSENIDLKKFSTKKVLIVDDIPLNVFLLKKTISQYNFDIDVAENGEEGVQMATNTNYDIIFMDIHMPKKNGFDASVEIIEKGIETPIITITADVTKDALKRSKEIGIKEFVKKPFTPETIHSIIEKYITFSD